MKSILIIILLSSQTVFCQGYCSLRNPQAKIKALYPECNFYKTVIATIDENARNDINKIIPFPIHYYEVGRHNLYVINEPKVRGLIHARTEESKWGLIEIVWSLNMDLTIKDFSFQRCRSHSKNEVLNDSFKSKLIGKNFYEIIRMFNEGHLNSLKLSKNGHLLAQILVRSALKTIALTDLCWSKELDKIRRPKVQTTTNLSDKLYITPNSNGVDFYMQKHGKNQFSGTYKEGRFSSLYIPISGSITIGKIEQYKKLVLTNLQALK